MESTENLAGVTVSGDYADFYHLVEAFHEITIYECAEKNQEYIEVSTRLLGICYDIRHAYMGDRELVLVDNHVDEDKMRWHEIIVPKTNVYYRCNLMYPEMVFAMIVINELIDVRIRTLTKKRFLYFDEYTHKNVVWDQTITTLRSFQSAFVRCVRELLSPSLFSRWLSAVTDRYIYIPGITLQYLDLVNIKYLEATREKRLKGFTAMTRRIANYRSDTECGRIKSIVRKGAVELGTYESNVGIRGVEYPDKIEW